ncbi:lepB protein [Flavobacterium limnosediminis JC2902]|uniref:Signal peptidase I n=1 Tax=Flavobacterium limnosediminis JC2902 TaxID=1341181 RepID=V6SPM7_9FLAO|nr:signal peptidase I [Flavobacterium limnosediminis]ESU26380.1 lepB protein [Flavobacterium limnosediminis JC2902]
MTLIQWFIFFLIIQVVHFLGTWKLYEKAGRKRWEAAIPVYNSIVLMKIIDRPTWWTVLLFVPIVNLIMFPVLWVETLRAFGKKSEIDTALAVLTLGFYIYYINYTQDVTYIPSKNAVQNENTVSSLLFAIVVATLVHTYLIQPFTIPSSSLEKSLLIGDFLFVSKFHYGARTPMTAVAAPMVHDSIPVAGVKSYSKWPQLPYFRFPGAQKIQRNDIVVFNWPADTVYKFFDRSGRRADKPIDKKSNYVKRCVGTPGDNLSIKDGVIFIDGKELVLPERSKVQYSYKVAIDGKTPINFEYLLKELNITDPVGQIASDTIIFSALTSESAARLKNTPGITSVTRTIDKSADKRIFPHTQAWSQDNLGPVYIPEQGKTVTLNKESLPFYKRLITDYEGNDLKVNGDEIRINGKVTNSYTFKQDYYWMMGDNRHNSEDSRYWGFVPADHVVGKPVFIWMSLDQNIPWGKAIDKVRWERLFTTVGGDGQPVSYFKYFVLALLGYFGYSFYKKRQAKKKA